MKKYKKQIYKLIRKHQLLSGAFKIYYHNDLDGIFSKTVFMFFFEELKISNVKTEAINYSDGKLELNGTFQDDIFYIFLDLNFVPICEKYIFIDHHFDSFDVEIKDNYFKLMLEHQYSVSLAVSSIFGIMGIDAKIVNDFDTGNINNIFKNGNNAKEFFKFYDKIRTLYLLLSNERLLHPKLVINNYVYGFDEKILEFDVTNEKRKDYITSLLSLYLYNVVNCKSEMLMFYSKINGIYKISIRSENPIKKESLKFLGISEAFGHPKACCAYIYSEKFYNFQLRKEMYNMDKIELVFNNEKAIGEQWLSVNYIDALKQQSWMYWNNDKKLEVLEFNS